MNLSKMSSFVIYGPAFLHLCSGKILALGKTVMPGEDIIIPKGKSIPIEVLENSLIEINLGSNACIKEIPDPIPLCWKEAIEKIIKNDLPIKVMVIGDTDSGKTTFSVYLANIAFQYGMRVAVIDLDPGQAEISLPTTIGYGFLNNTIISMDKIPLNDAIFIGTTTPSDAPMKMIISAKKLVNDALNNNADIVIINTCGWVNGVYAREYKCSLIQIISPDFIIAIQKGNELEHIIRNFENVIRITSSSASRIRSKEERKEKRENAYSKYFANSKERIIDLKSTKIICSYYTYGNTLSKELLEKLSKELCLKILYGETDGKFLFLVTEDEPNIMNKEKICDELITIKKGSEKGIIVGLYKNNRKFLGLGIISEINYEERKMKIITPVSDDISLIQVGNLKLNEKYCEVFKYARAPF
ncbi:MAG: hypothetical protein NO475_02125 [Candidatus Methanomethylicia archaeon]|nr:hypothetical protein [Candidatus Methanomethylicia archaeon]